MAMDAIDVQTMVRFGADKLQKVSLFHTDRSMVDLYCAEPGQAQKPHVHAGSDKLYYVLEGAGLFTLGEAERTAEPGTAVLAKAGVAHGVRNPGPGRLVCLVVVAPPIV
jgi:mannose-6-phosphate isomerase-like protein (cupin superfamily)